MAATGKRKYRTQAEREYANKMQRRAASFGIPLAEVKKLDRKRRGSLAVTSEGRTMTDLRTEYLRRHKELLEAQERSRSMERDFIQTKVLNAAANKALDEAGHAQRTFAAWLLQNHEALFGALPEEGTTICAKSAAERMFPCKACGASKPTGCCKLTLQHSPQKDAE